MYDGSAAVADGGSEKLSSTSLPHYVVQALAITGIEFQLMKVLLPFWRGRVAIARITRR
jgi:hypothetical protein